jgi:hypothetical protein
LSTCYLFSLPRIFQPGVDISENIGLRFTGPIKSSAKKRAEEEQEKSRKRAGEEQEKNRKRARWNLDKNIFFSAQGNWYDILIYGGAKTKGIPPLFYQEKP